eukprot:m.335128 g.335128  ORF g.335128 m.335128 type:complete len:388 (-) comp20523_c0_seq3:2668-3831(-)
MSQISKSRTIFARTTCSSLQREIAVKRCFKPIAAREPHRHHVFHHATPRKGLRDHACENGANIHCIDSGRSFLDPFGVRIKLRTHRRCLSLLASIPPSTRPYAELMRLDKPIGSWLLYAPCTWSIALATPVGSGIDWSTMGLFGVGAIIMRGAGCTINDMWDADIDKNVRRTAGRPLASGRVTHRQALGFLALQLSAGLGVLVQFDSTSIALGAASLGLVVAYPLMKRVTHYPQAVLGLVFNWGALLGYSCVSGGYWELSVMLPLYAAGWGWTMVYDTVYAHQDKVDDVIVGVKSTALKFGDEYTKALLAGFGTLSVGGLVLAGLQAGQALPYYAGVLLASGVGSWHVYTVDLNNPQSCWQCFNAMKWTGALVFAGAAANVYGAYLY